MHINRTFESGLGPAARFCDVSSKAVLMYNGHGIADLWYSLGNFDTPLANFRAGEKPSLE